MSIKPIMRLTLACLALASVWMCAAPAQATFTPVWTLGAPGRGWPGDGVGGGPDVDFIQENGASNPLPGSANSPLGAQQNDDDYYFAGTYPGPIGAVANDELGMERAFAGTDNTLRIHFNGSGIAASDNLRFNFEANNLDGNGNPPRYGIEVRVNGSLVMPELVVGNSELNIVHTTPVFAAGDVGLVAGGDNILELTGINYNASGGGNWMGMDFHQLEAEPIPEPSSFLLALTGGVLLLPCARRARKK